jgi:hypothetical protein
MDTAPDAVLTFQSRFARDDVAGELACFSQRFRDQSGGLSLQGYATLRDRFLAPLGWLGRFVLRRDSLEDNLVGVDGDDALRVRLVYSLFGHVFEVDAVPEARFSFPDPAGERVDAPLAIKSVRLEPRGASPPQLLVLEWNMPAEAAHRLVEMGLAWAEVGNEWKPGGPDAASRSCRRSRCPPAAAAAGPPRVIRRRRCPCTRPALTSGPCGLRVELEPVTRERARVLPDGSLVVAGGADAPRLRWDSVDSSSSRVGDPR